MRRGDRGLARLVLFVALRTTSGTRPLTTKRNPARNQSETEGVNALQQVPYCTRSSCGLQRPADSRASRADRLLVRAEFRRDAHRLAQRLELRGKHEQRYDTRRLLGEQRTDQQRLQRAV